MLKVGLTGNIGSGKTMVTQVFSVLKIPVYHADEESKRFLNDSAVIENIRKTFGELVVTPTGEVDRKVLGTIVFSDPVKLSKLTDILHPLVIRDFFEWCEGIKNQPYIIHEAAILFETGYYKAFDKIIHVSCPEESAIERVMKRDGTKREEVLNRMRFQMNDKEKAIKSDFVIRNDGFELIIPQVLSIHRILSEVGS